MADYALQIEGVVKSYAAKPVLLEISFDLSEGEYLGLVGVNGAGKTTLIKSLLDFCMIDAGTIHIFGMDHREPVSRSRLAFLPEKFMPPYYLTGRDFLVYMSELHGVEYHHEKVAELLGILDLDQSALLKPVRQYSKGMGQKLGLAACLLSNKDLLLFDEPMSGLDPRARAYLKHYLLELKQTGKTLFFSTHLLSDVEALCDRVVILHAGTIHFAGTPQECCQKYQAGDLEQAYLACVGG